MGIKIGKLSISKFIKGMLGTRLIDPIEVYFLKETNTFYPIISKSGCSSVKLALIRKYNPTFTSKFPEIHWVEPQDITDNKVQRHYFKNFKAYRKFSKGKKICLVIRNPYERLYSCYMDVKKDKNIMYEHPSGLQNFFGINSSYSFEKFLKTVIRLPDYLSDRHFRSQAFYLDKGVDKVVGETEVILLENYNSKAGNAIKLNANNKSMPDDILNMLLQSKKFNKRFKRDIQLYNSIKSEAQ